MRSQQSHPTQRRWKREALPRSLRAITCFAFFLQRAEIHATLLLWLRSSWMMLDLSDSCSGLCLQDILLFENVVQGSLLWKAVWALVSLRNVTMPAWFSGCTDGPNLQDAAARKKKTSQWKACSRETHCRRRELSRNEGWCEGHRY